jgi:hypothetical protein
MTNSYLIFCQQHWHEPGHRITVLSMAGVSDAGEQINANNATEYI